MLNKENKQKEAAWRPYTLIVFILLIGSISTLYTVKYAGDSVKKSLIEHTKLVASTLDRGNINSLSGNESDVDKIEYINLKSKLIDVAKINGDIKFVYITSMRNGEIYFVADSEKSDSPDYSPPGQVYFEATDTFRNVFVNNESAIEGPTSDRWGSWISALSPITDPKSNEVMYVVGIDMNSRNYYTTLIIYGSIPALITILLSSLVLFLYRERRKERDLLALRSEFVSIVAHDLRTPLVGIKWSLDYMIENESQNLSQNQKESLKLMHDSSVELLKTANQILESTEMEKREAKSLILKKADIISILDEITAIFVIPAKEKNIAIVRSGTLPKELNIVCDQVKIKRAISNILSNAIKYSAAGKTVTIGYKSTPNTHIISITDQGIGIATSEHSNMFKEFYRTSKAAHTSYGTGLGLYYVKKIMELHKGRVWFESSEDTGTTFFLEIPNNLV